MRTLWRSKMFWISVVAVVAGVAAWQRAPVLAWFYAHQLAGAATEERARWVTRLAGLDEAALPALVSRLDAADESICVNLQAALLEIVNGWNADDPRALHLVERFDAVLPVLRQPGQRVAAHVVAKVLRQPGPPTLPATVTGPAGAILEKCAKVPELRSSVLLLAGALLERVPRGQWLDLCRTLAAQGLAHSEPTTRTAAVQMLFGEQLRKDKELLGRVVPLLRDPSPAVRRAALVALAPAPDIVSEDALLPLLHDADPEVQHVCAAALASRGLDENHLLLARLISDEDPTARLRVLQHLGRQADLDLGVWLQRLSQDRAPAVRAAAVRAAGTCADVDLTERLREMARADPSETVRQNALHYLRQRQR